jgi:hypothetical protein
MSLGIVFKGPEGIVLAADSRVTLNAQFPQPNGQVLVLPSTFDNATKLLQINGQEHVGVITFGLGVIGENEPRTAHSFIPEFEAELRNVKSVKSEQERIPVEDLANDLAQFFMRQWTNHNMPDPVLYKGEPMIFLVAGYNRGASYGQVYEFAIPTKPKATEQMTKDFGAIWGGQKEFVDRLMHGYDLNLLSIAKNNLQLDDVAVKKLTDELTQQLSARIPYQFLPLQDCVDLSIFLIRATINLQTWTVGIRGVGGAIDVATITKTEGFTAIQRKEIVGERIER